MSLLIISLHNNFLMYASPILIVLLYNRTITENYINKIYKKSVSEYHEVIKYDPA